MFRSRVTDFSREARGETILHEMAHMWFGDLVTMRWWDDLWLNESFATWAGTEAQAKATRWHHSWTTFTTAWKAWACKQDQLPSTHPIAADIPDIHAVEVNFDGITYAKGAAVLKQLVAYVGLRQLPRRGARLLRRALLRERDPRRPAVGARRGVGARPRRLVAGVAGDRGGEHAAAVVLGRRRRPVHRVLRAAVGGAVASDAALAPDRDRALLAGGRRADPGALGGDRRHRRLDAGARARRQCRGRTWC